VTPQIDSFLRIFLIGAAFLLQCGVISALAVLQGYKAKTEVEVAPVLATTFAAGIARALVEFMYLSGK